MTEVTELYPSPGHTLDIAKKADCEAYVVIGEKGDGIQFWHSRMTSQEAYALLSIVRDSIMDTIRGKDD